MILSIDQSTSATKALLIDEAGRRVARCSREHRQFYPQPGWVEHDPEEILENTLQVLTDLIHSQGLTREDVQALALSNQRETVVVWDRETGKPLCNAIVWQCSRASALCQRFALDAGFTQAVQDKTGLRLSAYFAAPKVAWVLEQIPGARQAAQEGRLAMGTIDSWLIYGLSGGKVHATDVSNASRTLLLNLETLDWDEDLLTAFGIPRSMLPSIHLSDEVFCTLSQPIMQRLFGPGAAPLPVTGVLGDSHAACFAQGCFQQGMAKATYGTGSSVMLHAGPRPVAAQHGVVCSVGWGCRGQVTYVLEGNINAAGDTLRWLRDEMGLLEDEADSGNLAQSVPDTQGVYLVPAFTGLGAPHWDSQATALLTGITRGTTRAHVVRAALEAIAYQIADVVRAMEQDCGFRLSELRADGGPTGNVFLMQFQADVLDTPVACAPMEELSSLGAAYMAGLSQGVWRDLDELAGLQTSRRRFEPCWNETQRNHALDGWKAAVARACYQPERSLFP